MPDRARSSVAQVRAELARAAQDSDRIVSLGALRPADEAAVEALAEGLRSDQPRIVSWCARALGASDVGQARAAATLAEVVDHDQSFVRSSVLEALAALGPSARPATARLNRVAHEAPLFEAGLAFEALAGLAAVDAEARESLLGLITHAARVEDDQAALSSWRASGGRLAPVQPRAKRRRVVGYRQPPFEPRAPAQSRPFSQSSRAVSSALEGLRAAPADVRALGAVVELASVTHPAVSSAAGRLFATWLADDASFQAAAAPLVRSLLRVRWRLAVWAAERVADVPEVARACLPELLEALDAPDEDGRRGAALARAIAHCEDPAAKDALRRALAASAPGSTRHGALRATLLRLGDGALSAGERRLEELVVRWVPLEVCFSGDWPRPSARGVLVPYVRTLTPGDLGHLAEEEVGVLEVDPWTGHALDHRAPLLLPRAPNGANGGRRGFRLIAEIDGAAIFQLDVSFSDARGWGREGYLLKWDRLAGTWQTMQPGLLGSWRTRALDAPRELTLEDTTGRGQLVAWASGRRLRAAHDTTPYHLEDAPGPSIMVSRALAARDRAEAARVPVLRAATERRRDGWQFPGWPFLVLVDDAVRALDRRLDRRAEVTPMGAVELPEHPGHGVLAVRGTSAGSPNDGLILLKLGDAG